MRIISKVGPIQCGKDSATAYLVAGDGPIDVEMGRAGDESTLDRLIARCPEPPALEPALADAARARGLRVRDLALEHAEAKLSLALAMAIGPKQAPLSSDLVLEFADAAAAYFEAEVWSAFDPDECVLVRFEPSGRCVEACAMGQLGETFGLALYDEPGTIARMVAAGDDAASRAILKAAPTVSFTLDEEPAFLVEAMKDLTGAPVAPFLMRLEKGKPKPFDDGRLAELTAATRAFTALAEGQPGVGTAHLRSGRVTARAERAALARAPSETSAAKLVGRNEPCPCGSGKKYKTCHMGRDVPGDAAGLLHERDAALVERVLQRTVESQPTEAIKRFGREALGGRSVEPAFAMPLAAYEWVVDGRTPAAAFLERDGASLSASERTLIEAQLRSRLAPWEVLGVEPGSSLELLNLLTGERRTVREKSASKSLVQRDVLLGRVVDFPEVSLLGACHHVPLESGSAAAVVTRVTEQGATPGFEQSLALFRAWEEAAEEERVRREAPCRVVNADEHEVVFVEDEFRLEDGAAGVAASRVGALEGAERGASRRGSTAFSLVRPGSTGPLGGGPVIVGSVRITKTRLVASSNSLVRADALKARLIDALQDVATYRKRTLTPHPTMPGGATLIVDQQIHEDGVSDEMVRRRWLDTPLPTLEGKTPREAVELPALRPLVHRALKEQENAEARRSRGQVSDGGLPLLRQFRRELGLDELGGPRPHRELDAAIGFGRRMSETLLDFAAPLLGALQRRGGPLSQQAYDAAMHFAADVWNVSVMEAMGESEERLEALRAKLARSRLKAEHVEHLDALVRRKEAAFAADRRTVVELRLQQERGHLGIAVGAGLAPDLVERVRAAGLSPTP